ncbi:MAG: glycogen/starch synthase [Rikenellaceae bacterium]
MVTKRKILYVCQQVDPYIKGTPESVQTRELIEAIHERCGEIRIFMPKYGTINERRNQLHEVIRLSGMNLIIDDTDHQLIIKVASIQSVRIQVYFIDNDDYFARKAVLCDEEGKQFEDNDERAIFFARGVLETVKKLRWEPAIVHTHGWFAAITAAYLRHTFADDPIFSQVKIVASLNSDTFDGTLDPAIRAKLESEGITGDSLPLLDDPTYENYCRFVISYVDGVVISDPSIDESIVEIARSSEKPLFEYRDPKSEGYFDSYAEFYDKI